MENHEIDASSQITQCHLEVEVSYGTWYGETSRILHFLWKLSLQYSTALLRECDCATIVNPAPIGEDVFHELCIAWHLYDGIGEQDVDSELFEHLHEPPKLLIELRVLEPLRKWHGGVQGSRGGRHGLWWR